MSGKLDRAMAKARLDELAKQQQQQHEKKYSDGAPSVTPAPSTTELERPKPQTGIGQLWHRYSGWVGAVVVIGTVGLFIVGTLADKASSEPYEPLLQGTLMALTDPLPQGISQTIVSERCSTDSGLTQISISSMFTMVALPDGSEPLMNDEGEAPHLAVADDFLMEFDGRTNGTDDFCDQRNFTPSGAKQMTVGFWVYSEHYFATMPESDQVIHVETDIFEVTN